MTASLLDKKEKKNDDDDDDDDDDDNDAGDIPMTPLPTPIRGESDWRDFRCLQLPNGVTVCLVHDKESKTTAAAACVEAGAAADPRELSGLAHFCEHMCFLGSQKYPGENEYKQYLAQHGGQSNASTSLHLTTYKFEVLAPHAEQAIDIFSNFFVAPLFTESGTGREVHAVDSENSKNLVADGRRRLQILKDLATDPGHYYTKFTTGNSQTLETQSPEQLAFVRQALLDFHAKHYTPERLTVVVAGPQSLDQLQSWVVPRFAKMKARPPCTQQEAVKSKTQQLVEQAAQDAPPLRFDEPAPPFRSAFVPPQTQNNNNKTWPFLLTVNPVRSVRRLDIMFPLPSVEKVPDQSPVSILSHLLGHEGPNSPFAVLQNQGLLTSLSAGSRTSTPDFSLFHIDVGLTEEGEKRWKEVVDVILQHMRLIHRAAVEAQQHHGNGGNVHQLHNIWGESCTLDRLFFHQTSPGSVYDLAPNLCRRLVSYGSAKCLSAGSRLDESPETLPLQELVDFSSRLVPTNCFIERCSKAAWEEMEENEKNIVPGVERKKEPWYGIDYFVSTIDPEDVDRWQGSISTTPFFDASTLLVLPRPNRYIPQNLELCADLPEEAKLGPRIEKEIDPPQLLVNDKHLGRLWHRLDDRYALPKSVLTLLIRNAAVENVKSEPDGFWQHDTTAAVHSSLLAEIFAQALAQETYDATLAGLRWNLSLTNAGLNLTCSGFSDRLADLALHVFEEFVSGSFIQESYFDSTKERFVRNLSTFFESRRADSIAMYYRDLLLTAESLGIESVLAAAQAATLESTKAHFKALLHNDEAARIECLYTGNVSQKEARVLFDSLSTVFTKSFARPSSTSDANAAAVWIPGDRERRLTPGGDIEFHFTSQNQQEENGAVLATFQSPIPGFRGDGLSDETSLKSSASIRLLCHILREPLFDELRTKQTLGYIVSSYYDRSIAVRTPEAMAALDGSPSATLVDFLVICVLSRKLAPPHVTNRMDEFLDQFRASLQTMPESQIRHHATALSTKLLKPIQKLGTEASTHFAKISTFAPEVLLDNSGSHNGSSSMTEADIPWDSVKTLARKIESLDRRDLLETWDTLVLPRNRARIVSCVYGTTFPLGSDDKSLRNNHFWKPSFWKQTTSVVNNTPNIIALRKTLPAYDLAHPRPQSRTFLSLPARFIFGQPILASRPLASVSIARVAALAVIGASFAAGWTVFSRSRKLAK